MKKILMLVKKHLIKYKDEFLEEAQKLNIELTVVNYSQILIIFSQKRHTVTIENKELSDFDLVFFRSVGDFIETQMLLSEYCINHSIPIVDSVFQHSLPWIDRKSFEYQRLIGKNIPIIDSYFVTNSTIHNIKSEIKYPTVVKTTNDSQGKGVFLCNSFSEIKEVFDKTKQNYLLIQKYISNTGDIRVLIIGNKIVGAIKRVSSKPEEFRNNVSLGGKAEVYQLSKTEEKIALDAAKAMKYEVVGVDLISDNKKNVKVIEVNRAPQFEGFMKTTGINVPQEIMKYLLSKCN
jgi:RimK family alpha-L-glutamate ligase